MLRTLASLVLLAAVVQAQGRPIRVPTGPTLSPDGKKLAFAWERDIWLADTAGGAARRLTWHPARESSPQFSRDGRWLAFNSDRDGGTHVFVMPASGGAPRRVTHGSTSSSLEGWIDAETLLVTRRSDRHFHYSETTRAFSVDLETGTARMLLDIGGAEPAVSPDGKSMLFTRGRSNWSRKGYRGPQATQLWLADLGDSPSPLKRLDEDRPDFQNTACKSPLWEPSGTSFLYAGDPDGVYELHRYDLASGRSTQITHVAADGRDDGIAYPTLSADGKTVVFMRRFDLHRLDLATGEVTPITLTTSGDEVASFEERVRVDSATSIAFTNDGKQMAFVAGDDIWVMDRVLKEPVRVTHDANRESSLVFDDEGKHLYFTSDAGDEVDIFVATCDDKDGWWWRADDFEVKRVTDDAAVEANLKLAPSGTHIGFVKGTDLFVMDADGSDHRRVVEAWSFPDFDWSPDGKWLVYATQDDDYNPDVFIVPLDGTRAPFNLSRHPDRDGSPRWSRDGKRIAFVSRRDGDESDIYWVNLAKAPEEETSRDRKLEEAIKAMNKGKKKEKKKPDAAAKSEKKDEASSAKEGKDDAKDEKSGGKKKDENEVVIDFDGLLDRMHRIRISDSFESGLIWSHDGKKLVFNATVDGKRGLYSVEFPDVGRPKRVADDGLSSARWLEKEVVGLKRGVPATMNPSSGKTETFAFSARTTKDWRRIRMLAFAQGWRAMRDRFYDKRYNNKDWQAIRTRYEPVAAQCLGAVEFSIVMNMMLGELNASHMGHRGGSDPLPRGTAPAWRPTTHHLGLRFDAPVAGKKGLVVESVIPGSPASRARSAIGAGEVVLSIDGKAVGTQDDVDRALTLDLTRDVTVVVQDKEGETRDVTVRPTTSVAGLLYDEWVEDCRARVEKQSGGKLGYLHIRGMNFGSFRQMEEDLFHAGAGKDGLIIDVRFNGGGSTTDHVLTALTQPVHAITVSRGSGEGYPQDRKVYASWSKPIVLMCNEHSFSNAEILSHAIKQLDRGRLVGMRTAGGVISTGSVRLLDRSSVRMPMRGWYLATTGEDMELNGCLPHVALWNTPGGDDTQLERAIETLAASVEAWEKRPRNEIVPAAEKRRLEAEKK